ncbi:MAG: OmpA family protein, partial [Geminicoccaceae bacterium]|nr:OmpA family protein [Geminicoccaceae bacterium]
YYFKIVGHTDSVGAAPFNEELSLERARIARDLFLEKVAIQPWRLFAQGRGEGYPLASNDDERGRAANRRVEIFAVKAPF